jgi:hypothetical protein
MGVKGTARVTQIAKHKCITEAAVIATAPSDHRDIRVGQCVKTDQFTPIRGRIEQLGDLDFGQLLPSCHLRLPSP